MIELALIDAFTSQPFHGNPAAVCLLETERDAAWMQAVAAELNQAETAFVRASGDAFSLRWFTPTVEEELCGHATLASAHFLWELGVLGAGQPARFTTRSGLLVATQVSSGIELDFPTEAGIDQPTPEVVIRALGRQPVNHQRSRLDHLVELASEADVRALRPDLDSLRQLPGRGLIVTARSSAAGVDFVSRFFAPKEGIIEDAVTGSAHCTLAPYWASRLGRTRLRGFQASARGGFVDVELCGARTLLGGQAVTVLRGQLRVG